MARETDRLLRYLLVATLSVLVFVFFSVWCLHAYFHRWHRRSCIQFLKSFVDNIHKIQVLLCFGDSCGAQLSKSSSIFGKSSTSRNSGQSGKSGTSVGSQADEGSHVYITTLWSWGMDATGLVDLRSALSVTLVEKRIRVVVCVQNECAADGDAEQHRKEVFDVLHQLCDHLHLAPRAVCCCIISDTDMFPGILLPKTRIGGLVPEPGSFRKRVPVFPHRAIDILPILCDVADYCLILGSRSAMATTLRHQALQLSSSVSSLSETSDAYSKRQAGASASSSRSSVVLHSTGLPGPTCLITLLSALALKGDHQAFVADVEPGHGLKTLRHEEALLSTRFPEDMDGLSLCSAFLHLWALAVSHGSFHFVKITAPCIAQMRGLIRLDHLVRGLLFICRMNSERLMHKLVVPPYVSLPDEIVALFLTDFYGAPITPFSKPGDSSEAGIVIAKPSMKSSVTAALLDKVRVSELHTGMDYRRVLCSAVRLKFHMGDHIDSFVLRPPGSKTPFRTPSQELCTWHLKGLANNIDHIVGHGDFSDLRGIESVVPLEEVAARIQMFCLAFLQKMNGSNANAQEAQGVHLSDSSRAAAFEAYTAAVEQQGHFMDLASEFLCERSDVHAYNQMMKDVETYKHGEGEVSRKLSMCGIRSYLIVEIVSASNLPNLDAWSGSTSDPYCSVEVKGKPETRIDTPTVNNNLNPIWNYYGEVEGYTFGDTLSFKVWDKDRLKQDEFIGGYDLDSTEFHSSTFDGDLELSNPAKSTPRYQNNFGSLHVVVRAVYHGSDKMVAATNHVAPPTTALSLKDILWRNRQAAGKLERIVDHVIRSANREAAESRVNGNARLHRSTLTPFWELAQQCVHHGIKEELVKMLPEELTPMERREQDSAVDDILRSAAVHKQFDVRHVNLGHRVTCATAAIVCDSFLIMKVVLKSIVEMEQLVVHSMSSTWKHLRRLPLVVVKVSLAEQGDSPSSFMQITLSHSQIIAILESTPGWDQAYQLLSEVPALCRTLHIEDPDVHPSMWCLSLGQLKNLAKIAEAELGTEAFKAAHMYDIVVKIIQPKTLASRMSWGRMVNWQSLRHVDIFVSHAWKENFETFVDSVNTALAQRLRADDVNLWICSFALFQSKDKSLVSEQIGTDVLDAPFDRALRRCKEVLVVRNAEVDNFQRAWCVYEIFRSRQLNLKITIAGPNVFDTGSVDILTCKASRAADEENIKNVIKAADLVDELNSVVTEIKQKGCQQTDDEKPPMHSAMSLGRRKMFI